MQQNTIKNAAISVTCVWVPVYLLPRSPPCLGYTPVFVLAVSGLSVYLLPGLPPVSGLPPPRRVRLPVFLFGEFSLQLCALPCAGTQTCPHFVHFTSAEEPPLIHRHKHESGQVTPLQERFVRINIHPECVFAFALLFLCSTCSGIP